MLKVLAHPVYARLFAAQVVALIGTGLLTVALGLLAFDLAGERAGIVLGTAYAIKMVAYVGLAPVTQALAVRLPRRTVLVAADLIRASVALALPFIDAIWQVYVLTFVLQAASAAFTPAFQAVIPDILPEEEDYTQALALSRLAYDLENLASPALAGLLLTVVGYSWLFTGTTLGFLASAALVVTTTLPAAASVARPFLDRVTRGTRLYLATPRLRGLLALTMTAAALSAFVLVNTVVAVQGVYGRDQTSVALVLAAFGTGSMLAALGLPTLLHRVSDRRAMLGAALLLCLAALATAALWLRDGPPPWPLLLGAWMLFGLGYSGIVTPSGRLLRRSAHPEDRPALFAAQFALSHACWLLTYPLAGWGGDAFGLPGVLLGLAGLGGVSALIAARLWRPETEAPLPHDHPDLPFDHPHLRAHGAGSAHRHPIVIDDRHPIWPRG